MKKKIIYCVLVISNCYSLDVVWDGLPSEVFRYEYDVVSEKLARLSSKLNINYDLNISIRQPEMITISRGDFIIGSNDYNSDNDETPKKKIIINYEFKISKYEITVAEYRDFCHETKREMPKLPMEASDNHPITNVSWFDAVDYTLWLSKRTNKKYRLPSESEWEYVASFSNQSLDNYAWFKQNSSNIFHKVGLKSPNLLGIYDILGNVSEWCIDWYTDNYSFIPTDGKPNFKGPQKYKVVRGGSWRVDQDSIRISNRFFKKPHHDDIDVGFRVVEELVD